MKSDLLLSSELWEIVKPSVIGTDRPQVADAFVSMMIDHGYDAKDIRDAFRGDYDIIETLKCYATEEWTDDETEELDDDYGFDDQDDEQDDDEW
jgi:hypothetical protein